MYKKKLMSLDDLYDFLIKENVNHFSANDFGHAIYVQVPGLFTVRESDDFTLFADIKIMHTGINRNNSDLKNKAAKHCMETLAYKPLLANFTDVNGEWDFTSHDFIIVENEDGEEEYIYDEKQIGCFTADKPYMKYDDKYKHEYIYGRVAIPRQYTKAAEIIERKNGTKVSVELEILDLSFDTKNKVLCLEDAVVTGCTCLGVNPETGEEVGEGMIDAHISLQSFDEKNNSIITTEVLEEIRRFNKNFEEMNKNSKEGGKEIVNKELFEELLAQYNVTEDQIEFEYENLSDEELTSKFEEIFGKEDDDEQTPSEDETIEDDDNSDDQDNSDEFETDENDTEEENENEDETEDENESEDENTFSVTCPDGTVRTFGMTVNELWNGLFNLVNDTYGEIDNDFYSVDIDIDEKTVIMQGWSGSNNFRQSYKRRGDTLSLEGERVPVKSIWVSELEEKALNDAKANFEATEQKLNEAMDKLEKYESEPEKTAIFESDEWSMIKETEDFVELSKRENYFDLSKEEITSKLNDMVLEFAKNPENTNFATQEKDSDAKKPTFKVVPLLSSMNTSKKKSRYGNLFSKK